MHDTRPQLRAVAAMLSLSACLAGCAAAQGHRFRQDMNETKASNAALEAQCKAQMDTAELDPIRQKVELYRSAGGGAPPFAIASNDTFASDAERPVIAKWAALRDDCQRRSLALLVAPSSANQMQAAVFQQDVAFGKNAAANVEELIVALYQQKLTYGEFAQKRYWITSEAAAAELSYRQSVIERDQQRQLQLQQQFANTLAAWGTYIQAVNSRQPQTVNINGTIRVQ
jgi:hypothetical protein